jgi:hypothetical protein
MGKGPRATVRRDRLVDAPHLIWNAFVDLLSSVHYDELTATQRVAYLAFRYDGDVSAGGHVRFFRLQDGTRVEETRAALARLGAAAQDDILERAVLAREQNSPESLGLLDDALHACHPDIPVRLEAWLESHLIDFIVLEG